MTYHTVTITAVRRHPSGLWVITDAAGLQYATKNDLKAALADRSRLTGAQVQIEAGSGWYYKELRHIELLKAVA